VIGLITPVNSLTWPLAVAHGGYILLPLGGGQAFAFACNSYKPGLAVGPTENTDFLTSPPANRTKNECWQQRGKTNQKPGRSGVLT